MRRQGKAAKIGRCISRKDSGVSISEFQSRADNLLGLLWRNGCRSGIYAASVCRSSPADRMPKPTVCKNSSWHDRQLCCGMLEDQNAFACQLGMLNEAGHRREHSLPAGSHTPHQRYPIPWEQLVKLLRREAIELAYPLQGRAGV